MRSIVLVGSGTLQHTPFSTEHAVLTFVSPDWDHGEGQLYLKNAGSGAAARLADARHPLVGLLSKDRAVLTKGTTLTVVLKDGECESDVLAMVQEQIRTHGGLGGDVEFIDTRTPECNNGVLTALAFG